ncbi:MAG TPA: DinB family protein [Acidimicrobiales bacterium]|nr:DinB family protein [Acidimicrobiales bacterium]
MYAPAAHDEITGLLGYIDQQLAALRAAIIGLTEDQARSTPCRSTLSIGGLLKHAVYGMTENTARLTGGGHERPLDEGAYQRYLGSFALTDDETGAGTLAAFDEARAAYLAAIEATDPDGEITEPPAPWHGIFDARPAKARYLLVHQIEEWARHAGHADIIREQLDGTAIPQIVLSLEGAPANDFFQPYVAEPGTIGA